MSRKRRRKNKKNNSTGDNQLSIDEAIQILENSYQTNQSSSPPESTDQSKELSHEEVGELPKSGQETNQLEQQEQGTSPTTKEKNANTQKENRPTTKTYKEFKQEIEEKPRQAFKDAQAKYKEILDKSKLLEAATKEAKQSFLSQAETDEEKELISESKYKEFKKARQEVFNEYKQQVIDARRAGNLESIRVDPRKKDEVIKFLNNIGEKTAEKMYGKNVKDLTQSEISALSYFGNKNASESYNKAMKVRQEALGKLLDEHDKIGMINPDDLNNVMTGKKTMREKNAMSAAAEKAAKGEKFKFGKGKVAMAVMGLAGLAGVTGLMFSGGRQQNSNLYNANQAMY